jgi:hypothetical protein
MTNAQGQEKNPATSGTASAAGGGAHADLLELQDGVGKLSVATEGTKGLSSSESAKRAGITRKDSETQEEDVFVDAES